MSEVDLCCLLDTYLASYSYCGGYEPTQEDIKILKFILSAYNSSEMSTFLHLSRWTRHMTSFPAEVCRAFPPHALNVPTTNRDIVNKILTSISTANINCTSVKSYSNAVKQSSFQKNEREKPTYTVINNPPVDLSEKGKKVSSSWV